MRRSCPGWPRLRRPRGLEPVGSARDAHGGDRAQPRPSRRVPRQRVRRAEYRVSARRRIDRRAARHDGRGARASAVHRDPGERGKPSALPGGGRSRQRGDDRRGLRLAAAGELFHQRGGGDRARRRRARRPHPRAARQRSGVPHRELRRVACARKPLPLGQRRARRTDLAPRPERAADGRGRRMHDRRTRADRRAPARRHPYVDRPREAATA